MQVRTKRIRLGSFRPTISSSHCKLVSEKFSPMYIKYIYIKHFCVTFLAFCCCFNER